MSSTAMATRRKNLRALIALAASGHDFWSAIGESAREHQSLSRASCRKIESAAGVPAGCLDVEDGVVPHLEAVRTRFGFEPGYTREIFHENMRLLASIGRSPTDLARVAPLDPHLMQSAAHPSFSTRREIEQRLGLPRSCLDVPSSVIPHLEGVAARFGLSGPRPPGNKGIRRLGTVDPQLASSATEVSLEQFEANVQCLADTAGSLRNLCAHTGLPYTTLLMYRSWGRVPTFSYRRGMEVAAGLPAGCLDATDGVAQLIPGLRERFAPIRTRDANLSPVRRDNISSLLAVADKLPDRWRNEVVARVSGGDSADAQERAVLARKLGSRHPTTELCRAIERRLGMAAGSMDVPGGALPYVPSFASRMEALAAIPGIRQENLRAIERTFGSRVLLCEVTGQSYDDLSQVLSKNASRQPAAKQCREIEQALHLPGDCLDISGACATHADVLKDLAERHRPKRESSAATGGRQDCDEVAAAMRAAISAANEPRHVSATTPKRRMG